MTAPHEPYPLRRSFLEERLGHAVGLVQFNAAELAERVSASTLAGIVVTASEAPIGTLEFDGLTILARDFAQNGNHAAFELTRQRRRGRRSLTATRPPARGPTPSTCSWSSPLS